MHNGPSGDDGSSLILDKLSHASLIDGARLSAGRVEMSDEAQALCFLAGANSIFAGEKLLTQKNNGENRDRGLMRKLGMTFLERECTAEVEEKEREDPRHFHLQVAE